MLKLLFSIFLSLFLVGNGYAEKERVFPNEGLQVFKGLDDTSSPPVVLDGRAADLKNITLDITGAAAKRNGYKFQVMLDTARTGDNFEPVVGLWELYKSDSTRTKLAVNGDRIYSWNTTRTDITGSDVIASGITVSQNNQYSWVTALDYAIGTNGVDPLFKSNGTTSSLLSFGAMDVSKAKCVIWWKNYLIVGNTKESGINHTTRIRWTNVGTLETWSDDDYIDIAPIGGQQIEGFATLYDNLFIFLTDSIYKVSLVGGDELLNVSQVSEGIGCIAKNSIQNIQIGNAEGLLFLSRDKTINYCDGVKVTEISTSISTLMDTLSSARLPYAVSVDDQANAHYYLACATSDKNDVLLDFHYGIGEWSRHSDVNANAFCVANDSNTVPQVFFGNYYSFIYQLNDPDKNSDVAGETGVFDSRSTMNSSTESGLIVLYDTSATFTDATGATVKIVSGTGVDEESIIAAVTSSGIIVVNQAITATGASGYSIGAIDAYYTTKWYDTGSAPLIKNFGELYLWASSDTSATMQVYHATDFSSSITSTDVDIGAEGSLWGTAIWGTSTWSGSVTNMTMIPLNVSGRYIKFKFSENTIDEPMELFGYSVLLWDLTYK